MEFVPRLILNLTSDSQKVGYINLEQANHKGVLPPNNMTLEYTATTDIFPEYGLNESNSNVYTTDKMNSSQAPHIEATSTNLLLITLISLLFCIIGLIGVIGNSTVILIILLDRQMRRSVTNLYIMNLAASDLLVMLFGIPEIAQFMLNKGWLLGEIMCKLERFVLVFSLYTSVITQVAVCVERYIAIVHPMKAHIFCSRRKMLMVIASTWPTSIIIGLPVAIYNHVITPDMTNNIHFCSLHFSGSNKGESIKYLVTFKYMEFTLFYLIPMIVQIVCYSITGNTLYVSAKDLHRRQITYRDGKQKEKVSDTMKQRKGVVKMLIASVIIYFISYSPHQVLLFYNTFSHKRFHETWLFLVFVTAMGYINSAANPILYCIFSQAFRNKFKKIIMIMCCKNSNDKSSLDLMRMASADSAMDTVITKATNGKCLYTKVPQQKTVIKNKMFRPLNSEL